MNLRYLIEESGLSDVTDVGNRAAVERASLGAGWQLAVWQLRAAA